MQIVLLCGGKSSRMWPLSDKILFSYFGKTVFERQVEMLLESGLGKSIHIVGNSANMSRLKELCTTTLARPGIHFSFSLQEEFSGGMLHGLLSAKSFLSLQKPVFVMSSNDIVEKSFFISLQEKLANSSSDIFLCGKKVEKYFPGGYLVLTKENHVEKIWEKPGVGNEPSSWVNLVLHVFQNPQILFQLLENMARESAVPGDAYERCLQKLFDSGIAVEMIPYNGFWQSLKYPWHHLDLMDFFLKTITKKQIASSVEISPQAVVGDAVVLEEGVKVLAGAVLSGRCYVGSNAIIGNHALVRDSHLCSGVIVGHSTEVARAYLGPNVHTHQNYVGDSVIDANVSFGAGTRTGNLRLDEKEILVSISGEVVSSGRQKLGLFCGQNVRVGINCSFMPGVKVGGGSFLGAGICFSEDIFDGSFVKLEQETIIKTNRI